MARDRTVGEATAALEEKIFARHRKKGIFVLVELDADGQPVYDGDVLRGCVVTRGGRRNAGRALRRLIGTRRRIDPAAIAAELAARMQAKLDRVRQSLAFREAELAKLEQQKTLAQFQAETGII